MRRSLLLSLALLPLVFATQAKAQDNLREVYFLDLVKSRTGNTIVVEADPDTEILVFNGGELALDNRNLIVVARHARIDADTRIKSFGLVTRLPNPGRPPQAAAGELGGSITLGTKLGTRPPDCACSAARSASHDCRKPATS
mgnify:CR=1 FL=1